MNDQLVVSKIEDAVLTVRLNRPDKLNSFIEPMAHRLQEVLSEAGDNNEVRSVLLTGNGKAFCVGQDLPEVVERENEDDYELGDTVRESYNPIIQGIRQLGKPVVCAVNGVAAGAGANIAFACDLVLASEQAEFVQSFSKIGLIPDSGGTFLLPRLVGMQRANAMYLLDDQVSAYTAEDMGLIYKTVPANVLLERAEEICRRLAAMPTRGFALYKKAINRSFGHSLDEQLEFEADLQTEAGRTRDYQEGVQAFLEKRRPEFRGE